jgi:hypothetical protein
MNINISQLVCVVCLFPGCLSPQAVKTTRDRQKLDLIVEKARALKLVELRAFIEELGEQGDTEALAAIYHADFTCSSWAAQEMVLHLPADQAVGFCKSFPINSLNWRAAFSVLNYHPKEAVIDYVKVMAQNRIPRVRCCCYDLCRQAGWNDLLEQAQLDRYDQTYLVSPNQLADERTLGQIAEKYIRSVSDSPTDEIP